LSHIQKSENGPPGKCECKYPDKKSFECPTHSQTAEGSRPLFAVQVEGRLTMLMIETARLTLRPFKPHDLNDLYEIRSDPDVMRYIGSGKPESIEQVRTALNKILSHWEGHGFGRWAAIDKERDKLIGWCGLSYLEDTEDVEIGYGIAKSHWGKGLTSEAAAAVIKWGFEDLGLDHIVAVAWPDNVISRRVMDRLGMKYVKMAYNYHTEVVYYSIRREEYQASSRTKSAAWNEQSKRHQDRGG
jgi:ribosomal-protein-alanine N-acetyltransferase